ncbi:hypothetical protein GCM10027612_04640 [Microbispora bryophytorum subsp. camponoti]
MGGTPRQDLDGHRLTQAFRGRVEERLGIPLARAEHRGQVLAAHPVPGRQFEHLPVLDRQRPHGAARDEAQVGLGAFGHDAGEGHGREGDRPGVRPGVRPGLLRRAAAHALAAGQGVQPGTEPVRVGQRADKGLRGDQRVAQRDLGGVGTGQQCAAVPVEIARICVIKGGQRSRIPGPQRLDQDAIIHITESKCSVTPRSTHSGEVTCPRRRLLPLPSS